MPRSEIEAQAREDGIVLRTVAEWQEMQRNQLGYGRDVVSALEHAEARAERDDLRAQLAAMTAEVTQARKYSDEMWPRIERAMQVLRVSGGNLGKHVIDGLCDEIERLREGREDEGKSGVDSGVAVARDIAVGVSSLACDHISLDPRLGVALPEGEPTTPEPYWKRSMQP